MIFNLFNFKFFINSFLEISPSAPIIFNSKSILFFNFLTIEIKSNIPLNLYKFEMNKILNFLIFMFNFYFFLVKISVRKIY